MARYEPTKLDISEETVPLSRNTFLVFVTKRFEPNQTTLSSFFVQRVTIFFSEIFFLSFTHSRSSQETKKSKALDHQLKILLQIKREREREGGRRREREMSVRSKRHQHQQPHLMRMSVQASRRSPTGGCVTLKKTLSTF